ncbi:hypothetical protein C8J57DRAFT_336843 [Mycena rebaudengoi]|nr:hypothetical protein C8J57DRAFT_259293 [Mycena rebaudengoi]KAJ7290131.1 hypothetical protein C8J57DRAFT_336843 [Mycena rebaudengoi]
MTAPPCSVPPARCVLENPGRVQLATRFLTLGRRHHQSARFHPPLKASASRTRGCKYVSAAFASAHAVSIFLPPLPQCLRTRGVRTRSLRLSARCAQFYRRRLSASVRGCTYPQPSPRCTLCPFCCGRLSVRMRGCTVTKVSPTAVPSQTLFVFARLLPLLGFYTLCSASTPLLGLSAFFTRPLRPLLGLSAFTRPLCLLLGISAFLLGLCAPTRPQRLYSAFVPFYSMSAPLLCLHMPLASAPFLTGCLSACAREHIGSLRLGARCVHFLPVTATAASGCILFLPLPQPCPLHRSFKLRRIACNRFRTPSLTAALAPIPAAHFPPPPLRSALKAVRRCSSHSWLRYSPVASTCRFPVVAATLIA